jgi:hypothetical protein
LKDSSYVAYETYIGKYIENRYIINEKLQRFTVVLGGRGDYFLIGSGRQITPYYFQDGWVKLITGDKFIGWYPIKIEDNKQSFFDSVYSLLVNDSDLKDGYDAEYKGMGTVQGVIENKLQLDIKYFKLYLDRHSSK